MLTILKRLKILIIQLLVLLLIFQLTRLIFYLFNYSYFSKNSALEIFIAFLWGTRFDLWVILLFNLPLILWALLPVNKSIFKLCQFHYTFINSFILIFNIIDIKYFDFTLKRSTADLFNLIFTGNDVWILLPRFLVDFWYLVILFIAIVIILYKSFKHTGRLPLEKFKFNLKNIILLILIWILVLGSIFTNLRGTRLRPVNLMSASIYTNSTNVPLVLNTPFSIIKTLGKTIPHAHFYMNNPEKEFNPVYTIPVSKFSYKGMNVVILILESFSKEHIGFFSPQNKGFTPFLDSLLKQSVVISNSYANGRKSIETLPSILSSIPSLMNTPYVLSQFSSNKIFSLPAVLSKNGYYTSFYHGGTNGTMGFDVFSSMAGIKNYFGRWQYPNNKDYDGNWGIWDEPYLQYVKKQFDKQPQPFFSVIYTLSSHHPYKVPDKYKKILPQGQHEILQTIAYTDLSLKKFFNSAKNEPWYKNTIFVITADHVFGAHSDFYYNRLGSYSVPIAFYIPSDTTFHGILNITAQHSDIYPSVLQLLGICDTIFSFGRSIWDSLQPHFAINYINGEYQIVNDNWLLTFDGNKSTGFYQIKIDTLLNKNLIKNTNDEKNKMETLLKAIIQQYDNALIHNHLVPK